jgi:hypothetical protein
VIFLNQAVLFGLAAVAVPILIHLIHRRQARVLDWGAMQFLLASVAARHRRTLIEEILLMVLRCLFVTLVVAAAARPFLPSTSRVPWALVLPALLAAAVCGAVAAVAPARRLVRWGLGGVALLLVAGACVASAAEYVRQGRHWSGLAGGQDVAIVLDGSLSMKVRAEGEAAFSRALDEARAVIAACRPADTVAVVLAGPAPRRPVVGPTADHELAAASLSAVAPVNGPMAVLPALDVASAALADGPNPTKKIVLITDGQRAGWQPERRARWQFLAGAFEQLPAPPRLVCRTFELPAEYANVGLAALELSRSVVGTDRPVGIVVEVANTGTGLEAPSAVELSVDGGEPMRARVGAIEPGAAERIGFQHRFASAGPHVLTARLLIEDDLAGDDRLSRVVTVLEELPALIVDGAGSARPLDSAADFLSLAMAPGRVAADALIRPTVLPLAESAGVRDLTPYRLVVLADVARLPPVLAGTIELFVRRGGGLLIAPGERCAAEFYNNWRSSGGRLLSPARLEDRRRADGEPMRLAPDTFDHPALAVAGEPERSDAQRASVDAWWRLAVEEGDPGVRVGARLQDGSPFLVERKLGEGRVMLTAASLGRRDGNLPTLKCFVPLVHEFAYYLAAPTVTRMNVPPGAPVSVDLPEGTPPEQKALVLTPSGERAAARLVQDGAVARLSFEGTQEPGLHRVLIGAEEAEGPPFVVLGDRQESVLAPLTAADLEQVGRHVDLFRAGTTREMLSALRGEMPGRELWKQLALCALLVLIAEVAVARWITLQRRSHAAERVRFGIEVFDPEQVRRRLAPEPEREAELQEAARR